MIIKMSEREVKTIGRSYLDIAASVVENDLGHYGKRSDFVKEVLNAAPGSEWNGRDARLSKYINEGGKITYRIWIRDSYVCDIADTTTSALLPVLPIFGGFIKSMKSYFDQLKGMLESFDRRHR